ncbi:MAG: non-hydrolyzing UDP-N-acetylglucosamine 2-epimerase [Planctomycetaceae bacterium]
MIVSVVAGARPNFMKLAPLVAAAQAVGERPRIIHTGQHYDAQMSDTFFAELGIPDPDVNLGVGSGSHVFQIAEVMRGLEREFTEHRPQAVVVVGDVNSTLAAALAGQKLGIRVAHVEAGLRSFDRAMPEEINRILTDAVSDWLFTSEPVAEANLLREGIAPERIHYVGNVMIDTLLSQLGRARDLAQCRRLGLAPRQYQLVTLHRPSNVDDQDRLRSILDALAHLNARLSTIFVVHPRTRKKLQEFGLASLLAASGFLAIEPLGYLPMLSLIDSARLVLTDSGGIQEETTALRIPCLTLRENTERPITIEIGTNELVGWRTGEIVAAATRILDGQFKAGRPPDTWDGRASERIVARLQADLNGG